MAELLKIEKGIPLPKNANERAVTLRKTINNLQVGDSFLMRASSLGAIYDYGKPLGFKFSTRKTEEDPKIIRVWRRA